MAEHDGDLATRGCLPDSPLEGRNNARTGAPGHMESWHGIPRPARQRATPLRPADDREETDALGAQPRTFLAGGERDICLGPFPGPLVFRTIESGRHHPVLHGPLVRVADPETPLFR